MGSDLGWFALNVGDGNSWAKWETTRKIAQANGVTVFMWRRCHSEVYLRALLAEAVVRGVQPLPNLEDELKDALPPSAVARICSEYPVSVVGWSLPAWLYNDVDFVPLTHRPALLQLFPTDNRWDPGFPETAQRQCVTHARGKGFTYVGVTLQTYAGAQPEWYAYHGANTRSYYTADDVNVGGWTRWKPSDA